ncbi:MAG TPA: aldolase/citrate lyase family protein [Bacteroidia bacterium]|nr:aldolase/citrate lyase family protein [Bacteroidia bacterium]
MTGISLYQCIPSYKPLPTVRLIKSLPETNCKILIDIEDSIQDVQNPELTPDLKAQARRDFAEIVRNLPDHKFSLRINSLRSKEFEQDKELLHRFANNIESVFLPKVESSSELIAFYNEFGDKHKLNLIIETQRGIESIDEILSSPFNAGIDFVFFGNYDFHLDSNIYPITEQNTLNYWKIVAPIISKVENRKLNFGNSPYANIADIHCLDFSVMQLTKLCSQNFALMSLHKTQTIYFQKLIAEWRQNKMQSKIINHNGFTSDVFINKKQKGRSFAWDGKRIITPQEYLLLFRKENG